MTSSCPFLLFLPEKEKAVVVVIDCCTVTSASPNPISFIQFDPSFLMAVVYIMTKCWRMPFQYYVTFPYEVGRSPPHSGWDVYNKRKGCHGNLVASFDRPPTRLPTIRALIIDCWAAVYKSIDRKFEIQDRLGIYKNRWRTFSCLFYWDRPHSCAPKGGIFIHLLPTTLAPISAVPLKRTASQPIPRLKNETRSSEEVKINALAEVKYSLPLFLNRCNLRSYHTYKENLFRVVFRRPEPETGRRGVVFISYLPGGEAETGETIVSLGGAATAVGKWRDLLLLPIFGPHVLSVGIRQVKIIFQLDGFSITRDGTWKWHTVCSRTLLHVFCFFYGTKLLSIGLRRRRDHATHVVSGADCVFPQLRKQHFHSAFGEIELLTKSINFDGGGLISWPKIGQKQLVAHHPRGRALFSLLFVVEWKRPWMNWALGARVGVDARAPRRWAAVSVGIDQWRPAAHATRLRREKSLPQGRRAWIGRHCCCCCRFPMRYWSSREPPFRQQPPPPPPPEALFILNIHLHAHSRKVGEREREREWWTCVGSRSDSSLYTVESTADPANVAVYRQFTRVWRLPTFQREMFQTSAWDKNKSRDWGCTQREREKGWSFEYIHTQNFGPVKGMEPEVTIDPLCAHAPWHTRSFTNQFLCV